MAKAKTKTKLTDEDLIREWRLDASVTLGSAVRLKGILLEIRARLPRPIRKDLDIEASALVLRIPKEEAQAFAGAVEIIEDAMKGVADLPVIPREIEDILSISASLRHKWLKDGRLKSAGTRTVRLRGRARKITFHVFDPHYVEDLLDRDQVSTWREQDKIAAAESRRHAAARAAHKRLAKKAAAEAPDKKVSASPIQTGLKNWDDFDLDGLLR